MKRFESTFVPFPTFYVRRERKDPAVSQDPRENQG